tara:strand:+ start:39 stop:701 length:663 start_codon:yes stop_codon:yes gene_type:complete
MIDLTPYWIDIAYIAGVHLIAVMSPGPDLVMILRNTLSYSKRNGIFAALGTSSGILVHATYTLFGLGVLIKETPVLFNGIRVVGACYLLYVGWRAIVTAKKNTDNYSFEKEESQVSAFYSWRMGFVTNVTNPMVLVLFLSIFSTVIKEETPLFIQGFFMAEVLMISLVWFLSVAFLFSVPVIRGGFKKLGHYLDQGAGVILILLAFRILYMAWQEAGVSI